MKPLTKATQELFTPMVQQIASYKQKDFKHDRLELIAKKTPSGNIATTMDLFSVPVANQPSEGQQRLHPRCRETIIFPNRLFEKKHLKDQRFAVPLTDSNVELIFHCWPWTQIVANDLARKFCTRILAQGIRQDTNANVIAQYKQNKILPDDGFICKADKPLRDFQKPARNCGMLSESFALFMQQGTGKTATAISTMVNDAIRKGGS